MRPDGDSGPGGQGFSLPLHPKCTDTLGAPFCPREDPAWDWDGDEDGWPWWETSRQSARGRLPPALLAFRPREAELSRAQLPRLVGATRWTAGPRSPFPHLGWPAEGNSGAGLAVRGVRRGLSSLQLLGHQRALGTGARSPEEPRVRVAAQSTRAACPCIPTSLPCSLCRLEPAPQTV